MERKTELFDLDDACLVNVFRRLTPLPDLFNVAAVCKRFKNLSTDGRLWLRVSGAGLAQQAASAHRGLVHDTLQEAVAASRPGDTILVEPGVQHLAQNIAVTWPLRLLGGGRNSEDTVVICPPGADSVLDFRASGKVGNMTMHTHMAACLIHRSGTLQVAGCTLHCISAPGLEHLSAPLVTLAASPPRARSSHLTGSSDGMRREEKGADVRNRRQSAVGKLGGSAGVLSVVETKIRGSSGSRAVRAGGSGILAGVRVINLSRDTLFWFTVDSAEPGLGSSPLPAWASPPGSAIPAGAPARAVFGSSAAPLRSAVVEPLFPGSSGAATSLGLNTRGDVQGQLDLDQKSKEWQRAHCVTVDKADRYFAEDNDHPSKRFRT